MAVTRAKHRRRLSPGALGGVGKVGVVVLLLAAFAFANATGAVSAIDQADRVRAVEGAEAAARTSQAHLSQALILAVDRQDGGATEEAAAAALDQGRRSLGALLSSVTDAYPEGDPLRTAADRYLQAGFALLDSLEAHSITEAKQLAEGDVAAAYVPLAEALDAEVAAAHEALARARSLAGLVANFARFAVALIVPGVLILIYRALGRRQVRTEQERAREEAQRAQLEAQLQAERDINAAKDEFIANVSHELRTPLTAIAGFAEVLEEGMIHDPETGLELVNLIAGQTAELARMVEDLLTASRADAGTLTLKLEDMDIRDSVEKVVAPFRRFGNQISVSCPSVTVYADPVRVRQILRNLVANACAHGGQNIDVSAVRAGRVLTLWVADDGPGVSDDVEDRLFQRYVHQGDLPLLVGSVGLGLAIARVLAREMGGDVRYERVPGHTHFVLELPVSASDDRSHPAPPGPAGETSEVAHG